MRFALALMTALAFPAGAQEISLQDGERIEAGQLEKLRRVLPPPLWEHRALFFDDTVPVVIRRDPRADDTPVDCTRRDLGPPAMEAAEVTEEPLDARGSIVVTYRYESADEPDDDAPADTWLFLPARRGVRHLEAADAAPLAFDSVAIGELESFSAIPLQGSAACQDAVQVLVPSRVSRDDLSRDRSSQLFGQEWELRDAWLLQFDRGAGREDVYVDRHQFEMLYSFTYDRSQELWKITSLDKHGAEVTLDVQKPRDEPAGNQR